MSTTSQLEERSPTPPSRAEAPQSFWDQFWDRHGWQTTLSVSVGIGAFGLLQFIWGVMVASLHPAVTILAEYVLLFGSPLLVTACLTGFALPVVSLIRHRALK